jgi:hypothetical protein
VVLEIFTNGGTINVTVTVVGFLTCFLVSLDGVSVRPVIKPANQLINSFANRERGSPSCDAQDGSEGSHLECIRIGNRSSELSFSGCSLFLATALTIIIEAYVTASNIWELVEAREKGASTEG